MNSLIMCMSRGVTTEEITGQLRRSGISVEFRDDRITVSHEGSVAWIEPDSEGELKREYEPDEQAFIESLVGPWNGYSIDYRSLDAADFAVAALCERWPCVVDDEDEFFGWGIEYLQRRRGGYVPHSTA